jgi:hypothetical protein
MKIIARCDQPEPEMAAGHKAAEGELERLPA